MDVVVCVKHVPDASTDRSFEADLTVDRAAVDGLLCELDEHAVEEALTLVEAHGGEVTALTMGPGRAGDALRRALQMGVHKGVHVIDDAVAGSDAVATSLVLAAALRRLPHDLVLCGMASTDGSMSVVPAMLAERLGYPQLTFAASVSVEGGNVRIERDGDGETLVVEADQPAVLSVTDQCNKPRYPSFKQIMAAKKKPVDTYALADLEVSPDEVGMDAAWTKVESADRRPPRQAGTVVVDEGDGARRLVEFLAQGRFV